ncbi:hypothetical protein COT94_02285 [Candidatus Falkowbacteria bacterium CG10_big_fil_rev_8_21_14_0_10_37_14]|uniref:Colicin V production protein n=1 Tax=Candidatus Falkowbacteria bacterium CG10_big_fil_rev_8_21_14_0_10_37_14 TaxID=1974561 RepID=A0A2M6WTD8_9BACT|nr:CvpA family protein [Candidatus Falkowbacteria bacterium]PIT96069.1 MAG: hypothetical protein COT94_02285 [Candidatus Falkowbacteria bacterium CG10_big_fil_rev_8_21_14_0_10_37_14]
MTLPTTLPLVDIILLLFLAGFVFYGLFFGLIRTVGSILGVVVGTWVASRVYLWVFSLVGSLAFGHENTGKVIVFIVCFTVINRIIGLLFAMIDRTYHLLTFVPFLKTINRLGGVVLGFLEGGLVLGLLLYVSARYVPAGIWAATQIQDSGLAPFFLDFANWLVPLLPEILRQLKSII